MNKLASPSGNFAAVPDWNDVHYAVVVARCGSLAADSQATVRGVIRITAVDALVAHYLARHFAELRSLYPALSVELIASSKRLDLSRREADIAIRLARPVDGDFVVRRLRQLAYRCLRAAKPGRAIGLGRGVGTDSGNMAGRAAGATRHSPHPHRQ